MKRILVGMLLLAVAIKLFCQQTTPPQPYTHHYYLKKSKGQKVGGIILVSGGVLVLAGTVIVAAGDAMITVLTLGTQDRRRSYGVPVGIGVACIAGSISLFVSAAKNKKKARAASVYLEVQKVPVLQQTSIINHSYPSLGIKIGL